MMFCFYHKPGVEVFLMTILMRPRMVSYAMFCVSLLMAFALAAAPVFAQQGVPATDQQRLSEATRSLFDAVQANDLAAVQASIAAGADLTARDQWGLTPVDLAIDKSYFDVAHFLLSMRNFQGTENTSRVAAPAPAAGLSSQATSAAIGSSISGGTRLPKTARAAPEIAVEPSAPRQETRRQPVERWPSDQPNPFDPAVPAPGAVLPGDGPGEAMRGDGHTAAAERSQVQ
jgi:hypothetical protein